MAEYFVELAVCVFLIAFLVKGVGQVFAPHLDRRFAWLLYLIGLAAVVVALAGIFRLGR